MRVVLLVLLVVMSACSPPAGSAETTTSTVSASTTSTSPTTTTLAVTTSTEPECVELEGVLRDSRGFVCPPNLTQGQSDADTVGYLPGTYKTRIFEPAFTHTRQTNFQAGGENSLLVNLDYRPNCQNEECTRSVFALSPDFASQLRVYQFQDLDWVQDLTTTEVELWGYSGTQIDFTVDICPSEGNGCFVVIERVDRWHYLDGSNNRLLFVDVPGGPVGFQISAHHPRFDLYWSEVAEPILASIEFNDG